MNGGENPEINKCDAPEISLVEGKLVAKSKTEGSKCYTTITSEDIKDVDGNDPIELSGVYKISSYAHAVGYLNSDTVIVTLIWVNPTLDSTTGNAPLSMEAKKAVLIRTNGSEIIVSGTERGERIALYSTDGREILTTISSDGETTLPIRSLAKGDVVIVKYGGKAVKVVL